MTIIPQRAESPLRSPKIGPVRAGHDSTITSSVPCSAIETGENVLVRNPFHWACRYRIEWSSWGVVLFDNTRTPSRTRRSESANKFARDKQRGHVRTERCGNPLRLSESLQTPSRPRHHRNGSRSNIPNKLISLYNPSN